MASPEIVTNAAANLDAAVQVERYVRKTIDIGASNKFGDNLSGLLLPVECVSRVRDEIVKDLKGQAKDIKRYGLDPLKVTVETWAAHAKALGCGNCGEQSALAFVQLRDVWKVSPLDWMQVGGWAHGFVAIGRIAATNAAKIESWNPEAVVCDPWKRYAHPAKDAKYLLGEQIEVIYRIETT
ncbi:MAG: hypothetical protein NEA02_01095 [Thermoanaerobaculia bacterium]|jgi:hypothetical protein|nr:hypothetical protein [Thermoanaerobaculia bacterium]